MKHESLDSKDIDKQFGKERCFSVIEAVESEPELKVLDQPHWAEKGNPSWSLSRYHRTRVKNTAMPVAVLVKLAGLPEHPPYSLHRVCLEFLPARFAEEVVQVPSVMSSGAAQPNEVKFSRKRSQKCMW